MSHAPRKTLLTNTGGKSTGLDYSWATRPTKHTPSAFISKTNVRNQPKSLFLVKEEADKSDKRMHKPRVKRKGLDLAKSRGRELPIWFHFDDFSVRQSKPLFGVASEGAETSGASESPTRDAPQDVEKAKRGGTSKGSSRSPSPYRANKIKGAFDLSKMTGRKDVVCSDERPILSATATDSLQRKAPQTNFGQSMGRKRPINWRTLGDEVSTPEPYYADDKASAAFRRTKGSKPMGKTTGREASLYFADVADGSLTRDIDHSIRERAVANRSPGALFRIAPAAGATVDDLLASCNAQLQRLDYSVSRISPSPALSDLLTNSPSSRERFSRSSAFPDISPQFQSQPSLLKRQLSL